MPLPPPAPPLPQGDLGHENERAAEAARVQALRHIVFAAPWFVDALHAVRSLGVADWCIGAGALRNLVWDHLHGHAEPTPPADIDVATFDAAHLDRGHERALQARLQALRPALPWEVTNQAAVHLWFEACFGHAVPPLPSLHDAVASWPEYATAVAVRLHDDGRLEVIAPYGLGDLFAVVVRRNPARVSVATYRERVQQKRYAARWPRVTVVTE